MFNTQETIIFMYRYSCETDPYLHLQLPVLFVSFFSRSFKKTSEKIVRCFDLADIIFKFRKNDLPVVLCIREVRSHKNMKSDKNMENISSKHYNT